MIAYLEGTVLRRDEESCVLLTATGVGYRILLHAAGLNALPGTGEPVQLHVHTLVREDALLLFGFASWEERQAFGTLLGAPKLGPKTALAILGCYAPGELAALIAREDASALTRVPGIGAKTAKRLLLDLKDKLHATKTLGSSVQAPPASPMADCTAALLSLGYARHEVDETVRAVFEREPDLDAGSAIRQALKIFAAK